MIPMAKLTLPIINEKGLHARASAKFVEVVESHDARAAVSKDGIEVSGDSIMGLLMLGASRGTSSRCVAKGSLISGSALPRAASATRPCR